MVPQPGRGPRDGGRRRQVHARFNGTDDCESTIAARLRGTLNGTKIVENGASQQARPLAAAQLLRSSRRANHSVTAFTSNLSHLDPEAKGPDHATVAHHCATAQRNGVHLNVYTA